MSWGITGSQIRDGSVEIQDLAPDLQANFREKTTYFASGGVQATKGGWEWCVQPNFEVPEDGTYLCLGRLRVEDNTPSKRSYGLAVSEVLADGFWMLWQQTAEYRNGAEVVRLEHFKKGQKLGLLFYSDDAPWTISGSLSITRLS